MMARWQALAAPGFDEDIRLGEDHRYLFTLARRGVKACGLRDRLTLKRESRDSLSVDEARNVPSLRLARLRTLVDIFETPAEWRYLPAVLRPGSIATILWTLGFPAADRAHDSLCRRLLEAAATYGDGETRDGRSPLIVLHLLHIAAGGRRVSKRGRFREGTFNAVLVDALHQAIAGAAPLAESDLTYWRDARVSRSPENGALALVADERIALGSDEAPHLLTEAIRAWSVESGPRRWTIMCRLAPRYGLVRGIALTDRVAALTAPDRVLGRVLTGSAVARDATARFFRVPFRLARVAIRRIRSAWQRERTLRDAGFPPI